MEPAVTAAATRCANAAGDKQQVKRIYRIKETVVFQAAVFIKFIVNFEKRLDLNIDVYCRIYGR